MPTPLVPVVAGILVQTKSLNHPPPPPTLWKQLAREQQMQLAQQWAKLVRQIQLQNVSMEEKDVEG